MPPIPTYEKERRERNLKNVLARHRRQGKPAAWIAQVEASLVSVRATGAFLPAGTRWAEGVPTPQDLPDEMKPINSHKSPAMGGAGGPAAGAGTLDLPSLLARIEALEKRRYCDAVECAGHMPDEVHSSKQFGCPRCKKMFVGDCFELADFTYHKSYTACPKFVFDATPRFGIVPVEPETIGDTGFSIPKHNAEVVACWQCYTEEDGDRSCCDSVKEAERVDGKKKEGDCGDCKGATGAEMTTDGSGLCVVCHKSADLGAGIGKGAPKDGDGDGDGDDDGDDDDGGSTCEVCGGGIKEGDFGGECQFSSKCGVKVMHKDCGLLNDEEEDSDDEVWTCDNCNKCSVCDKAAKDFIHKCGKCGGLYCEDCNSPDDQCTACEFGRCDKCKKVLNENFELLEEDKEPVKTCEACRK